MATAWKTAEPEAYHHWRKRGKYHRFHCALLGVISPELIDARGDAKHHLSDVLGDAHDLAVFEVELRQPRRYALRLDNLRSLVALASTRRAYLQNRAIPLGQRLFAEEPGVFIKASHARFIGGVAQRFQFGCDVCTYDPTTLGADCDAPVDCRTMV